MRTQRRRRTDQHDFNFQVTAAVTESELERAIEGHDLRVRSGRASTECAHHT